MHRLVLGLALALVTGCVSYEQTPLDEQAVLAELVAAQVELPKDGLDVDPCRHPVPPKPGAMLTGSP